MKTHTKMIAASLSLITAVHAFAGVGGLNVQSNLGEPFSGSIVVTGREAQALIQSGSVSVSGGGIHGTVVPQGSDKALIRLRSSAAINDPVLNVTVKAGNQTRQYTVMVNPANYRPKTASNAPTTRPAPVPAPTRTRHPAKRQDVVAPQGSFGNENVTPIADDTTSQAHQAVATPHRSAASARPRYYRAHSSETLASIAARYRPRGMSVQRAMRALVAANPRAFRNGNPNAMYRNVTLYIPTASQWYAYSNRRVQRPHHVRTNPVAPVADMMNRAPTTPAPSETVANPQQTTPTPPAVTEAPKTETKPAVQKQPEKAVEPNKVASTPVLADSENKAKETPAAEPSTATKVEESIAASTASAEMPVQTASVAVASDASAVVVAASQASTAVASAPEPIKQPPMPVEEEPMEEEGFDWMGVGVPVGAAALLLGGGAAYLLNRRKKAAEEEDDEEDDDDVSFASDDKEEEWTVNQNQFDTASKMETADDSEWDLPNDTPATSFETSDELFDLPEEELATPATATNTKQNSFNLDNFEPDNFADFSVEASQAEESDWVVDNTETQEDQWDLDIDSVSKPAAAVAATAVTAAVAAKADDWLDDSFLSTDEPVVAAPVVNVTDTTDEEWLVDDFVAETPNAPVVETATSNDDWLSETFTVDEPTAAIEVAQPATDLDVFDLDMPSAPVAPAVEVNETADALNFGLSDDSLNFTEPTNETATSDDGLDFALPETAPIASDVHTLNESSELDNLSFDVNTAEPVVEDFGWDLPSEPVSPAVEETVSVADFDLDLPSEPATPAVEESLSLNDFGLDLPTEAPAAPTTEEISLDDFGLDLPAVEEPKISLDAPEIAVADFDLNDIPAVEEAPITLDVPESAVDDFGLDLPREEAEPVVEMSLDDFGLDMPVGEPAAAPVAADTSLAFADNLSMTIDEPAPAALPVEEAGDIASWDIADAPKQVDFVSESVDMSAPMEARLELAKMYLEIDDAVAARETLRELIQESSGDVQQQAQQLLNELGG